MAKIVEGYRADCIVAVNHSLPYRMHGYGKTAQDAEDELTKRMNLINRDEGEITFFKRDATVPTYRNVYGIQAKT